MFRGPNNKGLTYILLRYYTLIRVNERLLAEHPINES